MRNTTTLLSTLALLLLLGVSSAKADIAAVTACQDAAKTAIDGTVNKTIHYDYGTWLFIKAPQWDCASIAILTTAPGGCQLGSTIHAEGTLSKPDKSDVYNEWILKTSTGGDGKKYNSSFSCK